MSKQIIERIRNEYNELDAEAELKLTQALVEVRKLAMMQPGMSRYNQMQRAIDAIRDAWKVKGEMPSLFAVLTVEQLNEALSKPRCVSCDAQGVPLDSEYGECADCRRNRTQRNTCRCCGADLSRESHDLDCESWGE